VETEGRPASRGGRVLHVARVLALASVVAVVGLGFGGRSDRGVELQQTKLAAGSSSALQLERDKMRVAELKAKLAKVERANKHVAPAGRRTAKAAVLPKAALAAGNGASKDLKKVALRDVWLTAARERGSARGHAPVRLKKVQVATVLKDIQASLAAQQQATHAALMLLASQSSSDAEDDAGEGGRVAGERGRTALEEGDVAGGLDDANGTVESLNCSDFTVANDTVCIPSACNVTEINVSWNMSLPLCRNSTVNDSVHYNETGANGTPPDATPAPWNEPQDTKEAAVESGAAGVVKGDVWAGAQKKPTYDTIYCYDDNPEGGFTRHARSATYCWYHRAYCELYCEGDIMSTPPPVPMNSPAAAAYGWRSGYVSWQSWAERLKMLSPFATDGPAIVGEPKFNVGGINKIHPVKIPETTGGTNGGIFEKFFQDGR